MKFQDYKYVRPDFNDLASKVNKINASILASNDTTEIEGLIKEVFKIKNEYITSQTLCEIRNSINVNDEYYDAEYRYIHENNGVLNSELNKFERLMVNHPKRNELEKIFGSYWFKKLEVASKTFDDSIIDLRVEEADLVHQYNTIISNSKIPFNGEVYNLSKVRKFLSDSNRDVRKNAMIAINNFFIENEEAIDTIYDKMVKNRTEQAKRLGYPSYVELGYDLMGRTDYDKKMVSIYREQVVKSIVPVASEIIKENANRIGINDPKFYDLGLEFLDGNPTPKGTKDELVAKALKMYSEMSNGTREFFNHMINDDLLDLEAKEGKMSGGYCTLINDYKSPFIFSNFNGTQGDVEVLTHEAGHAYMAYSCRNQINPDLIWPTSEAAEIHSMSMEFLTYPWMKDFFKEDTKKFFISHMNGALTFIPYGCSVDHFQHLVYENPNATPKERKDMWKYVEKLYTPFRDMEGMELYLRGGFFYNQLHIFNYPFYYIDYTLAQVCALEFYLDSLENRESTWERYNKLCALGGSKSFLDLLKSVDLHNPFIDGSLDNIVNRLKPVLNKVKEG